MTQRQLAASVGLTVNYLSLLENGHRSVSLETLDRLAGILGVPASVILAAAADPAAADPATAQLRAIAAGLLDEVTQVESDAARPSEAESPSEATGDRRASQSQGQRDFNWIPGF